MWYFIAALLGMVGGVICAFVVFESKRRLLRARELGLEMKLREIEERSRQIACRREGLYSEAVENRKQLQDLQAQLKADEAALFGRVQDREKELNERSAKLDDEEAALDRRIVKVEELQNENAILKRDLQGMHVAAQKQRLDTEEQSQRQECLNEMTQTLGQRYLKDQVKWIGSSLTPNNYASSKKKLQRAIDSCRRINMDVSDEEASALQADLKGEYEKVVRVAFEREEQARIKAQIREEQKLEKEIEREVKQLEREREAIQVALEKALSEAKDAHSEEVERLKSRLAEAEEKSQRAISRAQMTRSGHVYVISNIGSFGDDVVKIGMTRRLEPMDRVKELGDASVPFPFDVHMMIASDDAPSLENALHRVFHRDRVNKANLRKEFFRVDLDRVHQTVVEHHGEVEYRADAEALQYHESLSMSDDELEFIEETYDAMGADADNDDE